MLRFRQADDKAIQSVSDRDLASQARSTAQVVHRVEHPFLGPVARPYPLPPLWSNVDVARGTGTIAAAISVDAWHTVVGRSTHQRRANGYLDGVCSP